jgi:hypothetical protein
MMLIYTETGSIYELDMVNRQLRKIAGIKKGHRADTEEWKSFLSITVLADKSLYITWKIEQDENGGTIYRGTQTSRITQLVKDMLIHVDLTVDVLNGLINGIIYK